MIQRFTKHNQSFEGKNNFCFRSTCCKLKFYNKLLNLFIRDVQRYFRTKSVSNECVRRVSKIHKPLFLFVSFEIPTGVYVKVDANTTENDLVKVNFVTDDVKLKTSLSTNTS